MLSKKYIFILGCVLVFGILFLLGVVTHPLKEQKKPNDGAELFEMSIEQLMEIEITSASKKSELMYEAPVISVVVPRACALASFKGNIPA
jgi:hypothetical protein